MNSYTFNAQFITDLCVITTTVVLDGHTVEDAYDKVHGVACRQVRYDIGFMEPDDLECEIELVHSTRGDSNE
jgi:hypothetical protein